MYSKIKFSTNENQSKAIKNEIKQKENVEWKKMIYISPHSFVKINEKSVMLVIIWKKKSNFHSVSNYQVFFLGFKKLQN